MNDDGNWVNDHTAHPLSREEAVRVLLDLVENPRPLRPTIIPAAPFLRMSDEQFRMFWPTSSTLFGSSSVVDQVLARASSLGLPIPDSSLP